MSEILVLCVEATLRPELWRTVCDAVTLRMDGTAFMLFEYDVLDAHGLNLYGSRLVYEHGDLSQPLITGGGEEDNQVYFAVARSAPGLFATEAELLGLRSDSEIPKNPYRDAVMARIGSKSRAGGRLNDIGPWVDVAALQLPIPGEKISSRVRAEMNLILPVIGKALETGRIVQALSRRYGALLELFDRLDFAVGFIGANNKIILENAYFKTLLNEGDALQKEAGRISAPTEVGRHLLFGLLKEAFGSAPKGGACMVPRRSGRKPMIVKAAPISANTLGWKRSEIAILIVLDPEDEGRITSRGFEAFQILTPAELEVCELLVRGVPTGEISERRSTSYETTRNQIKSASSKLGCRNRVELVRLALSTHAPLDRRELPE